MRRVLPNIIYKDQTGFLKDCYIGKNITLFLDIQECMAKELWSSLCFLADWEKAYDLVDRPFLKKCLLQFGFGDSFTHWFSVLHNESCAKVIVNSFLTKPFNVLSGGRQGCPWAPLLFLCAIEPLACALRHSELKGVILPDGQNVIYSGYADDTTLFFF
jgi:hypothetical protein